MENESNDSDIEETKDDTEQVTEEVEEGDVIEPEIAAEEPVKPPAAESEPPEMSEIGTIFNIFLEPGRTFKDLRKKPRFILAAIIIAVLFGAYGFALQQKLGDERMRRSVSIQAEKSSSFSSLPEDQKKGNLDIQMTFNKVISYISPIFILISFLIGGLIYWGANKLMGGEAGFKKSVAVWVYASLPPSIFWTVTNFIVLVLRDPDEIDFVTDQRGLVKANATALFDGKEMPVLATIISTVDLFMIWGWVLAAIGLATVARLSKSSAWAIVLILALVALTLRVLIAYLNGVPS